jgi:hypothetical protein
MKKYFKLYNYQNKLLEYLAKLLTAAISKFENRINNSNDKKSQYEPIFIVGSPRTGSTILYELLTNEMDILYPNNFSWRFYRNFLFSFIFSNKIFKNKAHNCFDSKHGDTLNCGWDAPSECGTFWRKWIDIDNKNFYDFDSLTQKQKNEIKEDIYSVINYFDKPILFKNLVTGQMMRVLSQIFPNAKFIFVKRDTLLTAQSILKAKRKNNMNDEQYWSIKPSNYQELKNIKNPYEQIVKQIYYIEKQIVEDSKLLNKNNFIVVNYENLEKDIYKVKAFLEVSNRTNYKKHNIHISNRLSLSEFELKNFECEIDKLDWSIDYE